MPCFSTGSEVQAALPRAGFRQEHTSDIQANRHADSFWSAAGIGSQFKALMQKEVMISRFSFDGQPISGISFVASHSKGGDL
jgi:hypothetical protein